MVQLNKKITTLILSLLFLFSQSACITSILVPPLFIPLFLVGSVLGYTGGGMTVVGGLNRSSGLLGGGAGMLVAGAILDQDNPGQVDAFNSIPRDRSIAVELGVTLEDITDYNNDLNQIRKVALELSEDIRIQFRRPEIQKVSSLENLGLDPDIGDLAKKYGFESAQELIDTFRFEKLSQESLDKFSQATQLNRAQAKILLYYGFAIKSE